MAAPNVKFPRPIVQGNIGKDVEAHKRALSRARPDLYPWHDFTTYAGKPFITAFAKWKKTRGMNSLPKIGRTAHEVLERTHEHDGTGWAFDAVAVKLAKDFYDEFTKAGKEKAVRDLGVQAAFFWYSHRAEIAYSQARPFPIGKPPWVPHAIDCSGFATICHYAAGAPDPNGRNYDHLGYTGTLMDRGTEVGSISDLKPLDLIFYGKTVVATPGFPKGSPTHVAVYVGVFDGVHMVISNGSHPMGFYKYDYRSINHFRRYKVI